MHRTNPSTWYDPGPNQHHWGASFLPVFGEAEAAAVSSDQPRGLGTPIDPDMNMDMDPDLDTNQDSSLYAFGLTRPLGEVGEDVPLDTVETQAPELQPGYTYNATTTTTTNSAGARSIQAPQEILRRGAFGCERGCILCVPKPNMTWGYPPTGSALYPGPAVLWLHGRLPGECHQQPRGGVAADTAEGGSGGGGGGGGGGYYRNYSPHDAVAAALPTPSPTPTLGDWAQPAAGGGGGGHGGTDPVAQQQQQDRSGRKPRNLATALHSCVPCRKTFGSRRDAQRHEKTVHMGETINCPGCGKTFKGRKDNLKRHREKYCSQGKQLG